MKKLSVKKGIEKVYQTGYNIFKYKIDIEELI